MVFRLESALFGFERYILAMERAVIASGISAVDSWMDGDGWLDDK